MVSTCDGNVGRMVLAVISSRILIRYFRVSSVVALVSRFWMVLSRVAIIDACVVSCSSRSTRSLFCSRS